MPKTVKRKARHRYVYIVQWLTSGCVHGPVARGSTHAQHVARHGAFLSRESAHDWAQSVRAGRTFEVIPLQLHSEKKS